MTHVPVFVPPVKAQLQSRELGDRLPLYVLSGSQERWKQYVAPRGVTKPIRVTLTPTIIDTYTAYIDPEFHRANKAGTLRCAIGHIYTWDKIARDPRCAAP